MKKTTKKAEYEIPISDVKFDISNPGNKLGQGGFGTVFKGQWFGKLVAIKILTCELTGDVETDFYREIDLMLKLRVPQIVHTYGAVLNPMLAIVMEFMPNGNLYNLLRKEPNLSWPLKYQIALDVAYGIKYLHDLNILHRDLKSLNVLLDEKNQAKICDFGLAKIKDSSRSHTTSKGQGIAGTILWMAPELFNRKVTFTKASDVYALGMVLYEILSHQIPFEQDLEGKDPNAVIPSWLKDGERPDIIKGPAPFKALIEKCWSQAIDARPLIDSVIQSLERIKVVHEISKISLEEHSVASSSSPSSTQVHHVALQPTSKTSLKDLTKFLNYIAFGDQDKAEDMLKKNRDLGLISGDLTDCAGRQFKNITGFEYAVWALDWHMWEMIQQYISEEEARKQIIKLGSEGIDIKEPGSSNYKKTKQVSWQKLIDALQKYIDNHIYWSAEEYQNYWAKEVGGAQLLLPAHIIHEYTRIDRPFNSLVSFTEKRPPINDNWLNEWLYQEPDSISRIINDIPSGTIYELGKYGAWLRTDEISMKLIPGPNPSNCKQDYLAFIVLQNIRIKQLDQLLSKFTIPGKSIKSSFILTQFSLPNNPIDINTKELSNFLYYVVEGHQDKAEEMLKKNKLLALVTDDIEVTPTRTRFHHITAFQYAVWSLDWHMWEMLRKYMPEEAIKKQLAVLNTEAWIKKYGSQVNWQNLIDALQEYIDRYKSWSSDECSDHFQNKIGKAQYDLPTHVIQEYKRKDRSFYPCPAFNDICLPRGKIYDGHLIIKWKDKDGHSLGQDLFGWVRGDFDKAKAIIGYKDWNKGYKLPAEILQKDVAALRTLAKIRNSQQNTLMQIKNPKPTF
ncbi:MAG: protein kinase [Gammaproteobacteria bacterium]